MEKMTLDETGRKYLVGNRLRACREQSKCAAAG